MENPIADNPITGNKILNFKPKAKAKIAETGLSNPAPAIAVVTEVNGTRPLRVMLNDTPYTVTHYLSAIAGIAPSVQLGDEVLVSAVAGEDGVMIHGVMTLYGEQPPHSSFSLQDGKLVIEAQGAVILKSGTSTIELTEAGEIRIDGKDVRTVADTVRTEGNDITTLAREALTLLGGKVDVN